MGISDLVLIMCLIWFICLLGWVGGVQFRVRDFGFILGW